MHKIYTFILILLLSNILGIAQTTQLGIVQEYNENAKKTPLAGVELNVRSANNTVSDKTGQFSLQFMTLKPGDYVTVRRIEKLGYEIFNKEAVEQWNLNPDRPFVIVMCRSDKFKQLRDNYEKSASSSYARQLKKDQAALEKLKAEGKLKETEYQQQRLKLIEDYEKQLDNLETYVDRFSRIDLSELSSAEQEIIELVKAGKMEEAIARYDQMNIVGNLLNEIQKRDEVRKAISKLEEEKQSIQQSNDSLYAMADRHIQTLFLAGGSENNKKIANIFRKIADADTTNVEWLLKTGYFINEFISDYYCALDYYHKARRNAIILYGLDNDIIAKCYANIGFIYKNLGLYDEAHYWLMKTLEIDEKNYGEDNPNAAMSYLNIGSIYSYKGEYDTALDWLLKALDIDERFYGVENSALATIYNNIGAVYCYKGNYDEAVEYYKKSLSIYANILGINHPDVARLFSNIGSIYAEQGDCEAALYCYNRALEIRKEFFGSVHPYVASSCYKIGSVYLSQGQYDLALEWLMKALKIKEEVFGSDNLDVANAYDTIGSIHEKKGEDFEAIDCYKNALVIRERVLGPNHSSVFTSYTKIGFAFDRQEDYASAIDWHNKSLAIKEKVGNVEYPEDAMYYYLIGYDYDLLSNFEIALDYYQRALNLLESHFASNHYEIEICCEKIIAIVSNFGMESYEKNDYEKSLFWFSEELKVKEKIYPENHSEFAYSFFNIANSLSAQNDHVSAVGYYKKALDIFEYEFGLNNQDVAMSCWCLGLEYMEIENYPLALDCLQKAMEVYDAMDDADADTIVSVVYDIYHCLSVLKKENNKYSEELDKFMSDKSWTILISDEDSPATKIGLSDEYYILEFNDWNCLNSDSLFDQNDKYRGIPIDIVIMKDGKISRHYFDDKIGVTLGIKKVGKEEATNVKTLYKDWKAKN